MFRIVAHGGAGSIAQDLKPAYAKGIQEATKIGYELLASGSSALDAVEGTVKKLEENPTFNAGKGSVLTIDERLEMDAMIMDGATLRLGGVMGLENYLHPIAISRAILEHEKHILYSGLGADLIAKKYGFNPTPLDELVTDRIKERLQKFIQNPDNNPITYDPERREKYGTVGAVALDTFGNVASATSTGGILGKKPGRIGDTPIPGAGTYADKSIAISATGTGEFIIRSMLAMRIANYYKESRNVYNATIQSLNDMFKLVGGKAGVIVLSNTGEFTALHSTQDLCFAYNEDSDIKDFTLKGIENRISVE